jgi:hypothetical protein
MKDLQISCIEKTTLIFQNPVKNSSFEEEILEYGFA